MKPVPVPDDLDPLTHLWVEQVDGQGFAEVNAAHIHEFMACGFVGWRHKLCRQLVFFYMPGSLDEATEARVTELLKPLEYTGESTSTDIGIDLGPIPCDSPTMETQMSGVHSMEQLETGGRILISSRMVDYMDVGGNSDDLTELEGTIGGFDHRPLSKSNQNPTPSSSGLIGPICTIKPSTKFVQKTGATGSKRCGKKDEWGQRDAPSDRRHRLWRSWAKLANFFTTHQDLVNDLEPLPATVPGKHSNVSKPGWEGMQEVAETLCIWIQRNRDTARWLASQYSDGEDCKHLWEAALKRLDYREVWNTPQMDMPREDEPTARHEWLQAKERWLTENP